MSYRIYERVMADIAKAKDAGNGDNLQTDSEKVQVKIAKKKDGL